MTFLENICVYAWQKSYSKHSSKTNVQNFMKLHIELCPYTCCCLQRTFHKNSKKKLRSIFTIKKINHSFSKYLSLDDMQWSHCSSPLFKTTGEDCLEAVQRTQHCWNNFEIFIKFSAAELLLQCRKQPEIKWCEVWNIKAMLCDFNVAFTKMLLRINDM